MKKIYSTLLLSVAVAGTVSAQKTAYQGPRFTAKPSLDPAVQVGPLLGGARSTILWESDFSNASDWATSTNHAGTIPSPVEWQIGTGLVSTGQYGTPAIQSPTADNGYAMVNSDGGNNNTANLERANLTTANSFSTVGYPNVIVEFQTQYRRFNNEQTYLVVSTNNTDWPTTLEPATDISAFNNVFYVFEPGELTQGVSPGNPTLRRINISDAAGDQPQVWVRLLFVGIWGYAWYVDDFKVMDQPPYDLVMESGFLSHTGNGEEYGRIPQNQLNPTMQIGGEYFNFGVNAVTNATVAMNVTGPTPFLSTSSPVNLASGEAGLWDESFTLPGAMGVGTYNATFGLAATETPQEDDTDNNTYLRNFEVNNDWYSLDGIGNHPAGYQSLTSVGTNSFEDAADGLVVFNYYEIATATTVYGLEIGITNASQEGAYFFPAVWDTLLNASGQLEAPLYENQDVTEITAAHIADGKVTVIFDSPYNIQPGGYFVGIKMYSSGGATNMRVIDDLTVPQPGLAAGIEIPQDQVYTNGNAYHIRLAMNSSIGIDEADELAGISIFPNPSTDGLLQFRAEQGGSFTIQVTDMLGREVLNTRTTGSSTLDLRGEAAGVYTVRVSDGKASTAQRVTLK
jgi:hypothetical protein